MTKYTYIGPVMAYGRCISSRWEGTTFAKTERQAKNNLTYRAKQIFGYEPDSNLELPNELTRR